VKMWYDGFTFGDKKDIYNPWSIINFLKTKQFKTYWADSSSNGLINKLIKTGSPGIKVSMEILVKGGIIEKNIDEQIVFSALDYDETAIWSLLLASGYLKVVSTDVNIDNDLEETYNLAITNGEIRRMFANMIQKWFSNVAMEKNDFVKALIGGNIKEMNYYMNKVALATFSYFDTGKKPSEILEPERFYHGFVLGLIVELRGRYEVKSNRESGFGRYDVMIIPHDKSSQAIVLEFKVHDPDEEKTLEETVSSALRQINEKEYDIELLNAGIKKESIRHYGFAFEGKKVLIGTED
ncbi:ATP-binding protein, partial [Eubacterium sp. MSJ-13]|uniref:PD-(D/E)XK nuclease domain-containing protein n=1 Tax=Eubacterium sp. MSJ-13 TaxID=2841513 RepID=UPI001C107ADC